MRKLIFISILCAFITAPALAGIMKVEVTGGVGTTAGGEFLDLVVSGPIGELYDVDSYISTFCVETQETVGGNQYWVTLSDRAIEGGEPSGSGGVGYDVLDDETAWIYAQWLDVMDHTEYYANLVQNAIWIIEDEGGDPFFPGVAALITAAEAAVDDGWENPNIMVMNLWNDEECEDNAQDHLVRVPVPAGILLGILGLGVAGIKLRKYA